MTFPGDDRPEGGSWGSSYTDEQGVRWVHVPFWGWTARGPHPAEPGPDAMRAVPQPEHVSFVRRLGAWVARLRGGGETS